MSTAFSNMTLKDHIVARKNGSLLITGYTLYVAQLIISLTDENSNTKTVLTEIIVFLALLALREYKKYNPSIQNSFTQYDADIEQPSPRQHYRPPVAEFNNVKPHVNLSHLQGHQVNNLPPINKDRPYVI